MEKDVIDTGTLGYEIREARTAAGYATADEFAKAITEQTGVPVSRQTIYNIESGKQEPRLTLYLAILRLLTPDDTLPVDGMLKSALPPRWRIPLSVARRIDDQNTSNNADSDEDGAAKANGSADGGTAVSSKATPANIPTIDAAASIYDMLAKSAASEAMRKATAQIASTITRSINWSSILSDSARQALSEMAAPATASIGRNVTAALNATNAPSTEQSVESEAASPPPTNDASVKSLDDDDVTATAEPGNSTGAIDERA